MHEVEELGPGKAVMCAWCGNVRRKKVRVIRPGKDVLTVCRMHFERTTGELISAANREVIIRLRAGTALKDEA